MPKDFQLWHKRKSSINEKNSRVFFHEREVWWCSLGYNIGSEEDGKGEDFGRPVVIFRKFNNRTFWAIPLTTLKKENRLNVQVNIGDTMNRYVIIQQMRLMDAKRLYQYMGMVNKENYDHIIETVVSIARVGIVPLTSETALCAVSRPKP
jgi:mRNA interferase MazF